MAIQMRPNRIKKLRQRTGLTRVQFADKLGVTDVSIWLWENGRCVPNAVNTDKLRKLEAKLNSKPPKAAAKTRRKAKKA
jgi:DNA-binding transcriptional regulator YiaG